MRVERKAKRKKELRKRISIFLISTLVIAALGLYGANLYKEKTVKTLSFVKPSESEMEEIYYKIYKDKFYSPNGDNEGFIRTDYREIENEIKKKLPRYIKSQESLANLGKLNKNISQEKILFIEDVDSPPKNTYKHIKMQNKLIKRKYGVDPEKFYYVYQQTVMANREKEWLIENFKPSLAEIDSYAKKNPKKVSTYEYNIKGFVSEKDAKRFLNNVKEYGDFKYFASEYDKKHEGEKNVNDDLIFSISVSDAKEKVKKRKILPEIPDDEMRSWMSNPNRKEGDVALFHAPIPSDKNYFVVEFLNSFLDRSNSLNINMIFPKDQNEVKKIYSKLKESKNLDKDFKTQSILGKDVGFNTREFYPPDYLNDKDVAWLYSPSRKKGDLGIINMRGDYVIVKFNWKNNDKKYVNEAIRNLKERYIGQLDCEDISGDIK